MEICEKNSWSKPTNLFGSESNILAKESFKWRITTTTN
jgi:hypothetical protein